MNNHYVYILASERNGNLYVGAAGDLIKRIYEHKNGLVDGFTSKYKTHMLVYFGTHTDRESANQRERQIKEWKRSWKVELIEKVNPLWDDLYERIVHSK